MFRFAADARSQSLLQPALSYEGADGANSQHQLITKVEGHRVFKFNSNNQRQMLMDAGLMNTMSSGGGRRNNRNNPTLISSSARWANVNVSQVSESVRVSIF